ncbi:MAG: T9SS type A sorting domain-containing protein [Caldithrix sp.]|nr:T9SS type A sorting domain-containing protein [Caldithrix sp.]
MHRKRLINLLSLLGIIFFNILSVHAQFTKDSLKICALRVEFEEDNDPLTTGNGRFMVDTVTTDPNAIDPAPHNKLYFEDQIKAAANYFENVSRGRLKVTGDVYPQNAEGAYQLDKKMAAYNPNTTDDAINKGIAELFVDAVQAADDQDDIPFQNYDLVVIFHAGVGKDVDIGYDPTPQDIPSLFVTEKFINNALPESFSGIEVNDGQHIIKQGILLPETENQGGFSIALTGIFVSNIGSYLGLYDLFSPSEETSGIGRFGLMDVGLMNMNGLIPSPPGAFSRELLGWDEPQIIRNNQDNISIARLDQDEADQTPTLIKIPINENEYYLLEFRGEVNVSIDSLYAELYDQNNEEPTYLQVLKEFYNDQIQIGESGVLLSVPDYDWGLPGAGILIWHVDQSIVNEKGFDNAINDDPNRRAVDIEEADGSQDIGQSYSLLEAGFQTELGTLADFWFANRPKYLEGFDHYSNVFSDTTIPDTRDNSGAVTGIYLDNFSENTSTNMQFDYRREIIEKGFPLELASTFNTFGHLMAGSVTDKPKDYLFMADDSGKIYAVSENAETLLQKSNNIICEVDQPRQIFSMALADSDEDGQFDVLASVSDDKIYAFDLTQDNGNQFIPSLFSPVRLPSVAKTKVVTSNNRIFVYCQNDTVYAIDFTGQITERIHVNQSVKDLVIDDQRMIGKIKESVQYSAIAPLGEENAEHLIGLDDVQKRFNIFDGNGQVVNRLPIEVEPVGRFVLNDLDGNQTYDIVYVSQSQIHAFNQAGFPVSNFPQYMPIAEDDQLFGSPLIVNTNTEQLVHILVATQKGKILSVTENGRVVSGFPLSTGGDLASMPVIFQMDNDPELELAALTEQGHLFVWHGGGLSSGDGHQWWQTHLNATNNTYIAENENYQPISSNVLPAKRVFNYPNPNREDHTTIRYYLNEDAKVTIRIFDTAGNMIDRFDGPGTGKVDNEVRWNVSSVSSGVYLCQVEARSDLGNEKRIIKIMVVH